MNLLELERYLFKTLNPNNLNFFDIFSNSLQIRGRSEVTKVAFGVDASLEFFELAKSWGADALIVHHGLSFLRIANSIPDKILQNRLRFLFKNDISLFGFHFLLDSHPELGNAIQIIKKMKLDTKEISLFGKFKGDFWGKSVILRDSISLNELLFRLNRLFLQNAKIYNFGKPEIQSIGVVTGSGSSAIFEAYEKNLDLLITGDVSEQTQEFCRELKINLVFGGHYITEMFGLYALQDQMSKVLGLETKFFEIRNLA